MSSLFLRIIFFRAGVIYLSNFYIVTPDCVLTASFWHLPLTLLHLLCHWLASKV